MPPSESPPEDRPTLPPVARPAPPPEDRPTLPAAARPMLSPVARPPGEPDANPLSPDQLQALASARRRARKLSRTAGVARFSGWTMAIFAALTVAGSLCGDVGALLVGIGLGVIAYHELRGAQLLRQFDQRGPRRLGYNQLALAGLLVAYALICLVLALRDPVNTLAGQALGRSTGLTSTGKPAGASDERAAQPAAGGQRTSAQERRLTDDDLGQDISGLGDLQLGGLLGDIGDLVRTLTLLVYGAVAAVGLLVPGLTAWYYFSRARLLREFLGQTPAWIVEVLRAGG
jgi:hypothetical protein